VTRATSNTAPAGDDRGLGQWPRWRRYTALCLVSLALAAGQGLALAARQWVVGRPGFDGSRPGTPSGPASASPRSGPASHGTGPAEEVIPPAVDMTGASRAEVEGELRRIHYDGDGGVGGREEVVIDSGEDRLVVSGRIGTGADGRRVKARGRRKGNHLDVDGLSTSGAPPVVRSSAGGRKALVLAVNFFDDRRQPLTFGQIHTSILDPAGPFSAYLARQSSGRLSLVAGPGQPDEWLTLDGRGTPCDLNSWTARAEREARSSLGVDPDRYDHVMFVMPAAPCRWSGVGEMPGRRTWFTTATLNPYVLAHELGHNLGLGHANSYQCRGAREAVIPARAGACRSVEYADPFDAMGLCLDDFPAASRVRAGLAPAGTIAHVAAAAGSGRRGQRAVLNRLGAPQGPQSVVLARPGAPPGEDSVSVELRSPSPACGSSLAGGGAGGVLVRLGGSAASVPYPTKLLDAHPQTPTLGDAYLATGQLLADPLSGLAIRLISRSADSAVLDLEPAVAPATNSSTSSSTTSTSSTSSTTTAAPPPTVPPSTTSTAAPPPTVPPSTTSTSAPPPTVPTSTTSTAAPPPTVPTSTTSTSAPPPTVPPTTGPPATGSDGHGDPGDPASTAASTPA